MANAKIGSYSSYGYSFVESIDTTNKQLTPGDSGKIWMCDQNGTADVMLTYLNYLLRLPDGMESSFYELPQLMIFTLLYTVKMQLVVLMAMQIR